MSQPESYAVAVIGGATAGAEAAGFFAERGMLVAVFEQNARPYGKVEDGLPRWHEGLRFKEYAAIDAKLGQAGVHFVPHTRVGRDIELRELAEKWGFHAVVLANGAWADRPLAIPGAERCVGRGLVYQNPFIYWFNHYREPDYSGPQFPIEDGTLVIGGGLASIDVAKVVNLELALRALRGRGIEMDIVELETHGIPAGLAKHGLSWEALGLRGARLFYRRRPEDMPLVELPEPASDKVRERIGKQRARMLEKAVSKYLFQVEPLAAPHSVIEEDGRAVGAVFSRTRVEGGRLVVTEERFEARGPLLISSIGSTPAPLLGIEMKGELYAFDDWSLGRMRAYPTLFSVGNVVTGKGNIVASRKHARQVAGHVTEHYLALAEQISQRPPLGPEARGQLLARLAERQRQVGYGAGGYAAWLQAHAPHERPRAGVEPSSDESEE
jgi:ferredoxin--NADP+ reductase